MRLIDLTGQKFGRLTVLSRTEHETRKGVFWLCRCDCGKETVVASGKLKSGTTRSCGCSRKGKTSAFRHGMSRTRLYSIWGKMKERCSNPKDPGYKNYGGRGIKVCGEWQDFLGFYDWSIKNGYSDDLSIDRINVNGNYEPSNCRWADRITQANNKRSSRFIECNGIKKTISEWSRETGLSSNCIADRLKSGWSTEDAISKPCLVEKKMYEYNGESHTIGEWAKIYGLHIDCLRGRLTKLGWSIEKALTTKDTTNYIEFKGQKKTMRQWAKEYGLKYTCLQYRLQSGWDIEKALTTPSMRADKTTQKAV